MGGHRHIGGWEDTDTSGYRWEDGRTWFCQRTIQPPFRTVEKGMLLQKTVPTLELQRKSQKMMVEMIQRSQKMVEMI